MRKQLGQLKGKKCGIATRGGINFTGYIGEVDDHVLTAFARPNGNGDRRHVLVSEIVMLAPIDDDESVQ